MAINSEVYLGLAPDLAAQNVTLVAVSKMKPAEDIMSMYDLGQRDFGENYVQELVEKEAVLPKDIRWHFIGHLQRNKVKYIVPFVHLVHGVDSEKLLKEIDKESAKQNKKTRVLLQMHIAQEETKFGLTEAELKNIDPAMYPNVEICGFMGMASASDKEAQVASEFDYLKNVFELFQKQHSGCSVLSMGMSGDYKLAIAHGSNMVRVGSLLFGRREYNA